MKIQDLRIGNIIRQVEYRNGNCDNLRKITGVNQEGYVNVKMIFDYANMRSHPIKWFLPIEINEDWLIKLGFEKTDRFINKNYVLLLYTSKVCLYHYSNLSDAKVTIKYVHQLQNLYYSLTNQELSI